MRVVALLVVIVLVTGNAWALDLQNLGVHVQAVTGGIANDRGLDQLGGVLVTSVNEGGAAKAAGINVGDIILAFRYQAITNVDDLTWLGVDRPVDEPASITIWRNRERMLLWLQPIRVAKDQPSATPTPAVPPAASAGDEVSLTEKGGTYLVPVRINDAITLDFTIDSGAADVLIPADVAMTLFRTKTLSSGDFLGQRTYVLADGSRLPSARFTLRQLRVGSHILLNVTASVGPASSEPLLGQSFLSHFGSWTMDNGRHVLVLTDQRADLDPKQVATTASPPPTSARVINPTTAALVGEWCEERDGRLLKPPATIRGSVAEGFIPTLHMDIEREGDAVDMFVANSSIYPRVKYILKDKNRLEGLINGVTRT